LFYSAIEFASAFAQSHVLLVLRDIFGIAMGGERGVGASLLMEFIPPQARWFVPGLLQSGKAGYALASIIYVALFQIIGWRGMFKFVVLRLVDFYIRRGVPEWSTSRLTTADSSKIAAL
jgi:SHS family lactate transporter-like MFS transporter